MLRFFIGICIIGLIAGTQTAAQAIPYFSHEYEVKCQKCHTAIPGLNEFGREFMYNGYTLEGAKANRVFPASIKANLTYTSEPDPTGLPKTLVNEVALLLGGKLSERTNYFVMDHAIDGGRHGLPRDAWLAYRVTPDEARIPVYVQGGSLTLQLPLDPETFRETMQGYLLFNQTVGDGTFNLYYPKNGFRVRAGVDNRGFSLNLAALQGHDRGSGLPTHGIDQMDYAQEAIGPVRLSYYRYDGARPDMAFVNRLWRQGVGVTYFSPRWTSETVLQEGHDTSINGAGLSGRSSGGFTQLRYTINRRLFSILRYEGTSDPMNGLTRDLVSLLGFRTSNDSSFTIEDVTQHVPQTKNTINTQYTVAY